MASEIKPKLQEIMKSAMKAGEKDKVTFSRNLHAAIRKKEIDDRVDLDDPAIHKLILTTLKQRQDSIDQFRKGGRQDLVDKEEAEAAFLQQFLPPQLDDAGLAALVAAAIEKSGAAGPKDMGKVMQALQTEVQGRADGKRVSQAVRDQLAKKA